MISYAKISSSRNIWILVEASIFFYWQDKDDSGKFKNFLDVLDPSVIEQIEFL